MPRSSRTFPFLPWIAVVLACSSLAGGVGAQTPRSDWETSAYKGRTVGDVRVVGVDGALASELRKGLALASTQGLLNQKRPVFYPQTLTEDIDRALLFLARRGYPYAKVTATLEERWRTVVVTLHVQAGPPVRVASVQVYGAPEHLASKVTDEITLAADSVFVDAAVLQSVEAVTGLLNSEGYANAEVKQRVEWADTTHVVLHFDVNAGSVFYFRDMDVNGAPDDLVKLIHKTTLIKRGRRYSPKVIQDSEDNLRLLGLFRQIQMETAEVGDDSLDVVTTVMVREPRTIDAAVRYWTDEHIQGAVWWRHHNLFKGGRGAVAIVQSSSRLQEAKVSAYWPSIFWPRSRGSLTLGAERQDEDNYTLEGVGGAVILRWDYSWVTVYQIGLGVSQIDVEEKTVGGFGGANGLLTEVTFAYERKATDDWITPRTGHIVNLGAKFAPAGDVSENSYVIVQPSLAFFIPVFRTSGIAVRGLVGAGEPLGRSTEIIVNKRLYAGGANSMRGFHRRKLGPLDPNGNELGGEAKIEGSLELRYPLFWKFRTTTFTDIGQVWLTLDDINNEIEVAIGQGLWLSTPVGPLRGDAAYRLTNYSFTQPRWVFHFSIGPAF